MNHVEFQNLLNRLNLFLPVEEQIEVFRFQATINGSEYHITLELKMGKDNIIIKDIYKPHSFNVESLYNLQQIFFTSLYDKILEIGLISLIKQK